MAGSPSAPETDIAAGDFGVWIGGMQRALLRERDSDVPCDGCTACCRSAQFVHIEPDESDTLAHIQGELMFPAPGLPRGHRVLGYDDRGHCPMLVDGACSIYEHRPRACRVYDCRVFPAAGVDPDKALIATRTRRWRFGYPSPADDVRHEAVRAAATFIREHPDLVPAPAVPVTSTRLAVLAVEIHDAFMGRDEGTRDPIVVEPSFETIGLKATAEQASRSPTRHSPVCDGR